MFSLRYISDQNVLSEVPPTVSEKQLPWVQVTPYHPHNSVNLPRSSVYTLYNNSDNCPLCLIPFEQRNVIDNELLIRTINSCSLYLKVKNSRYAMAHLCPTVSLLVSNENLPNTFFASRKQIYTAYRCVHVHFSSASGSLLGRPAIFQWLTASPYL